MVYKGTEFLSSEGDIIMKKIAAAPANEVEILFNDRSFLATFNMKAVCYMQEELIKLNRSVSEIPIEEFGAIVLYSGIKVNHPDYTMEEARALAMSIRPTDLNEILSEYLDSSGMLDKEMDNAVAKKMIAQMLTGLAKSS